jgi:hypothetical protein
VQHNLASVRGNVQRQSTHSHSNTVPYSTATDYISYVLCLSKHDAADDNSTTLEAAPQMQELLKPVHSFIRNHAHDQPSIPIPRCPHVAGPWTSGTYLWFVPRWLLQMLNSAMIYIAHSHHIHTSVPNIRMYAYR